MQVVLLRWFGLNKLGKIYWETFKGYGPKNISYQIPSTAGQIIPDSIIYDIPYKSSTIVIDAISLILMERVHLQHVFLEPF